MKKYKVVGLPQMHNGGIGVGHPHERKKNRTKPLYSLTPVKSPFDPNNIKEKKLSRKQYKELGDMSYDEMVVYVNEQNDMFKELNLPAQYKMPDLSKVYSKKELQGLSRDERKAYKNMPFYDQIKFRTENIRNDDYYNLDGITNQEIVDPIPTTTDVKPNYYGDDHHNTQRSILESFKIIEKEYVLPKYKQREDGSYFKVRDEISRYDLEVEELRKKYETIEAQMRASFGDREGDPTHAEDWQNRDGKLYRKQLNALGSELQNLLLTRREQAGENVGVQQWSIDPETKLPKLTNPGFHRTPQYNFQFNKENEKEMGYIPKNYLLDFNDVVTYPKVSDIQEALKNDKLSLDQRNRYEEIIKDNKNDKQQQLNKQAELLWTLGAIEGYIPDKQVPIGGKIEDLENFISDYETDIADFKKQKTASNAQLKDYATYIGVKNFDPKEGNLASEANYKLLRKAMAKNPSDQHLMKIYKDVFMTDFDPNAVQLTQEQMGTMIDAGWGDGSMDAIYDLAKVVAYGAPAAPFVVSGLVSLMNNPLFTLLMDGYFAYETPQMVEDFYKNAKKVMETTDPGTWERFGSIPGLSLDALFVQMGITGGARIVKGANKFKNTLTGTAKSEEELSKVLREQLSAKGNLSSRQYKQRMKDSNFRKEEELIENASLEELQARAATKGTVMNVNGDTIIQTDSPMYLQYTKKGKPGVELTDASGKVISNTGTGDVIIGMGKTERVSIPGYNNVTVPELYTMPKVKQPYIRQKIKLPGGATIEIGVYNFDGAATAMAESAVNMTKTTTASKSAVSLIKNSERSVSKNGNVMNIEVNGKTVGEVMTRKNSQGQIVIQDIDVISGSQKTGIASEVYQLVNEMSGGKPVVSSNMFVEGEGGVKPGEKLWESLVKKGKAVKTETGYQMNPQVAEANFEIAKANEVGLGEQYGDAIVMAFSESIKIGAEELKKLSETVDVVTADGKAIVLNQKALPQGSSKVPESFKSEIDWAKWNKDIPNNKPLIEEYRAIEHNTKQDGTWMKNPDGTPFDGTKEQFVQQQSENFKKAFPEGADQVYRGVRKNRRIPKQGLFTAENRDLAEGYAPWNSKMTLGPDIPEGTGGIQELYFPKQPISADIDLRMQDWAEINLNNIKSDKDWKYFLEKNIELHEEQAALRDKQVKALRKKIKEERLEHDAENENGWSLRELQNSKFASNAKVRYWKEQQNATPAKVNEVVEELRKAFPDDNASTDDILKYMLENDIGSVKLRNIEDDGFGTEVLINNAPVPGRNVKSAFGNDGMFDMTNPDIYNSVLPLVGAVGAAAAAAGDEDMDGLTMAAIPLLIFGKGKKIDFKKVFTNITKLFKSKNIQVSHYPNFTQADLQSYVLRKAEKILPYGKDVTIGQIAKNQPEQLKKMVIEYVIERWMFDGNNTIRITEAEIGNLIAEQNQAAQFALDFNTEWMMDPNSKEILKPIVENIKEYYKLVEKETPIKAEYNKAYDEAGDLTTEYFKDVLFKGNLLPEATVAEALSIANDLLKVYEAKAAEIGKSSNYDILIRELKEDIKLIENDRVGEVVKKHNKNRFAWSNDGKIAKDRRLAFEGDPKNENIIAEYEEISNEVQDQWSITEEALFNIDNKSEFLNKDARQAVENMQTAVSNPSMDDIQALSGRGTINKKDDQGNIISGLVEGRAGDPSLEGTAVEGTSQKKLDEFAGVQQTNKNYVISAITKRSNPIGNVEELYALWEKGSLFKNPRQKGIVVRTNDQYKDPSYVAGVVAHEDRHVYHAIFNFLVGHSQHMGYGYQTPGNTKLGKKLQEILVDPVKVGTPGSKEMGNLGYTRATYNSSPIELDANLNMARVQAAYTTFQNIMQNPKNASELFKKYADDPEAFRKAVVAKIVKEMKMPEAKAKFIDDLLSDPNVNEITKHFKKQFLGSIDPEVDSIETIAGKDFARLFLEGLPALLIGAGLMNEMSDAQSPEELMTAGILGFATRGKIKGISKFRGVTKTPLTFKSFMPKGKIMNLAKDKMGRIPTAQALAILAKEGSGIYKSELLTEALKTKFNGKMPSKIDPETLKNLAEETIIPLDLEVIDKKSTVGVNPEYGFKHIGYEDPKPQEIIGRNLTSNAQEAAGEETRIATQQSINDRAERIKELEEEMDNLEDTLKNFDDYEDKGYFPTGTRPSEFRKELEEVTKRYDELIANEPPHNLENNTLVFDSEVLPGLGSEEHTDGLNSLAHVHYTVRSDSPDTFTATQFQSDFLQDRDKILQNKLNQTDEELNRNIKFQQDHIAAQQKLTDEGEMLPDGSFRTASGQIISKYLIENKGLGPSLDGLKGAQSFKAHKEGIKVLQKTWESRTLQETVDYAARNGQTKFRFPTGETASKLQNYGDAVTEAIKTGSKEMLVKMGDEEKLQITKRYEKIYPKLIEKVYGIKPRKVFDAQGNSWYEFDIPKDIIEGTRDIIAYKEGGQVKRKLKIPNPQFEELELTEKEALAYAQKGYIVEEIS